MLIVVGIPFPNINDIRVALKKRFNDCYKHSKTILSGSDWYCQQAFRAVNQATGRCIRHKFDYGAIIFLDERFCEARNRAYISKWLRNSIKEYECLDDALDRLKFFFRDIKERNGRSIDATTQSSVANLVDKPSSSKIQVVSLGIQSFKSTNEENSKDNRKHIDLECDSPNRSSLRCSKEALMAAFSSDSEESTFFKRTPRASGTVHSTSSESFSKEYSNSSFIQASVGNIDNSACRNTTSMQDLNCLTSTPEKYLCALGNCITPEVESSINSSVNSRSEKRKKHFDLSFVCHFEADKVDSTDSTAPIDDCSEPWLRSLKGKNMGIDSDSLISTSEDYRSMFRTLAMDNKLQLFCSSCKSALGLPHNNFIVNCSMTSLTKVHLKTLWQRKLDLDLGATSIPILISDIGSIDQQIYNRTCESISDQEIWCKDDGCVFKTVFCPFCDKPTNCLGVQVTAADASNIQFLNKILFFSDSLLIKTTEASKAVLSPCPGSSTSGKAGPCSIENFSSPPYNNPTWSSTTAKTDPSATESFSYTPDNTKATGWRTTKSKMRLPKRGRL